jgi:RNA polymerase sigma-70 factor (ECF subfamily)
MATVRVQDRDRGDALIGRAASGDEAAFAQIVADHHAAMRRVAYVVCGDAEIAEDAAQQAWQIAWRKLPSVRDPLRLRSWLVAIVANEARKLAGRQRRRVILEAEVRPLAAPSQGDPAELEHVDLARALSGLQPGDRELLALRYVAGLDSFEIARLRGGSASGTRARLARTLQRLRKELGDD